MKSSLVFLFLFLACGSSFAQTYRNQWLVGGNGTFSSKKTTSGFNEGYKTTSFTVQPNAGYFVINNLAVGARGSYSYQHNTSPDFDSSFSGTKTSVVGIAPFVRYYILPPGKKLNLLADASYAWLWSTYKFFNNRFKQKNAGYEVAAGPVFFVSPSVALELLADYQHTNAEYNNSVFSVNVGFEVHLGKVKKPKKA